MIFMSQNKIDKMVGQKAELDNYIGQFLNNRYLIRDLIGKGGMGRVYLAEDTAKGHSVWQTSKCPNALPERFLLALNWVEKVNILFAF